MKEYFKEPFRLECGAVLPELEIEYTTYGRLSPRRDNVIWVCHALTADSRVADWWPHTVEEGRFLDPEKWFVICANFLSSPYGTTSPVSLNPATGERYGADFPMVTVRDMVAAHRLLARRLGIERVELLIGSSIGCLQAMEWAIADPEFARRVALIATCTRSSAWAIAFNESQRMAIEADPTFFTSEADGGAAGMAVARSIALLSYRGAEAYNATQTDSDGEKLEGFRATTYQQHQGEKLRRRFDAHCYYRLTGAVDSHNIARGRASAAEVLRGIKSKALVVAITSDILFPPSDHNILVENIPSVEYRLINSPFGHDGFLVEYEQLDGIIKNFMSN
jgi:homoserine O-acetyltransferase